MRSAHSSTAARKSAPGFPPDSASLARPHAAALWAVALLAVGVLALGLGPRHARATTLRYQSVEALAADADAVVRARVSRVGTRLQRSAGGLQPEREAQLEVREVLAGDARAPLTVALRGGAYRGGERRVDGEARLVEGDEVVLFLVRDGARWRVLGMSLGVWQVAQAPGSNAPPTGRPGATTAHTDARDARLVRRVEGAVVLDDEGRARPVDETLTLAELRAAVQRARRTP